MNRSRILVSKAIFASALMITVAIAPGCEERPGESRQWNPPSGAATSGSLRSPPPTGIIGPFIAYTKETYGIFTTPASDYLCRYPPARNRESLTSGQYDQWPSVSPDGETIVYEHCEGDPYKVSCKTVKNPDGTYSTIDVVPPSIGLFAVPSRGGEPRQVTPASWMTSTGWTPLVESEPGTIGIKRDCVTPAYSPDGTKLCFVISDKAYPSYRSGTALATMYADGTGEPRMLLGPWYGVSNPKYSPDGSQIYFCSEGGIKRMPAEGGDITWVIHPYEKEAHRRLDRLFSAIPAAFPSLYACPEEESETPEEVAYWTFDFIIEPPGIAAVSGSGAHKGSHTEIDLMGMDGSDVRPLYGGSEETRISADRLSVSPDGKWIAFTDDGVGGESGLCVVLDLNSLAIVKVAKGDQPCYGNIANEESQ
jgi:hypothetical protein